MDLFILGAVMGVVGGLLPNPLQMIALTQIALGRWVRAIFVLLVPPLVVDAAFLFVTLAFFRFVPLGIAHYVAYAGGLVLIGFGGHSLWELRRKTPEEVANSSKYTLAGVSVALLAEVAAPGTWIYWVTIAGPILAEGRVRGYSHVVPFFAGGLAGYYGAALISTCLMAWGAGLHKAFKKHLILIANVLLLLMGLSYIVRAYLR
jgi:putative Mn2+ efflux pump MntP